MLRITFFSSFSLAGDFFALSIQFHLILCAVDRISCGRVSRYLHIFDFSSSHCCCGSGYCCCTFACITTARSHISPCEGVHISPVSLFERERESCASYPIEEWQLVTCAPLQDAEDAVKVKMSRLSFILTFSMAR